MISKQQQQREGHRENVERSSVWPVAPKLNSKMQVDVFLEGFVDCTHLMWLEEPHPLKCCGMLVRE